mmetsp:Transcript_50890/g.164746  ORF Transcript_50890/g.164746 Transcript_50890/m.164746 type:complete len:365 (+) Transcript_50890:1407-2501(+)
MHSSSARCTAVSPRSTTSSSARTTRARAPKRIASATRIPKRRHPNSRFGTLRAGATGAQRSARTTIRAQVEVVDAQKGARSAPSSQVAPPIPIARTAALRIRPRPRQHRRHPRLVQHRPRRRQLRPLQLLHLRDSAKTARAAPSTRTGTLAPPTSSIQSGVEATTTPTSPPARCVARVAAGSLPAALARHRQHRRHPRLVQHRPRRRLRKRPRQRPRQRQRLHLRPVQPLRPLQLLPLRDSAKTARAAPSTRTGTLAPPTSSIQSGVEATTTPTSPPARCVARVAAASLPVALARHRSRPQTARTSPISARSSTRHGAVPGPTSMGSPRSSLARRPAVCATILRRAGTSAAPHARTTRSIAGPK